jgi:hypothetical protein
MVFTTLITLGVFENGMDMVPGSLPSRRHRGCNKFYCKKIILTARLIFKLIRHQIDHVVIAYDANERVNRAPTWYLGPPSTSMQTRGHTVTNSDKIMHPFALKFFPPYFPCMNYPMRVVECFAMPIITVNHDHSKPPSDISSMPVDFFEQTTKILPFRSKKLNTLFNIKTRWK